MNGTINAGSENSPVDAAVAARARSTSAATMNAAKQALAKANATIADDRRRNSPACVASDQKLVDRATEQMAAARANAARVAQAAVRVVA